MRINDLELYLVAVGQTLYATLGFHLPLVALDAATGKVLRTYHTFLKTGKLTPEEARRAIEGLLSQGAKVIISTASKTYLDMKYDDACPLGLKWAGFVSVEDAYTWEPATQVAGVSEADILGVEAPLWSETLRSMRDVEFMAFPRLAVQGRRMDAMGINFYHAPEIPWRL